MAIIPFKLWFYVLDNEIQKLNYFLFENGQICIFSFTFDSEWKTGIKIYINLS